jgi:outer membrane protein OmpA-like peptidoglycan-associated protein
MLPRVEGTIIRAYEHSPFDEGVFLVGVEDKKLQKTTVEGKLTRIVYIGTNEHSTLALLRNYQSALADLGEVEEKYSCRNNECPRYLPRSFTWTRSRPKTDIQNPDYIYGVNAVGVPMYTDQLYYYGVVTTGESRFHVSLYSAKFTDGQFNGRASVHLEISEEAGFEPTLVFVSAEEMSSAINTEGHVALYGIYFDFDSAQLKAESAPTLLEIAKSLGTNLDLKLYVVGHTDNKGSFDYNQSLSERRAQSVVTALVHDHGIGAGRLMPVGAGVIAPIASNDTEAGRALNRRVELVKQ